jgi:hypothetical protein
MSDEEKLIKLSWMNGKALTFNPDDYMKIRSEFRIVGRLIGVPASLPRNAVWNGLPAAYSGYETKLMLEREMVILEDKTGLKEPPTEDVKEAFEDHQRNVIEEQIKHYIDSRLESTKMKMDQIIKGKRKKLMKSGVPEDGESS